MKYSDRFNEDWAFYQANARKFSFCGEAVTWQPDTKKSTVSAKEAFAIFDQTGVQHPCLELDDLLAVITCKKSVNFHIKMWVEGYDDMRSGIPEYLQAFINPPLWIEKAFENSLRRRFNERNASSGSRKNI